jgi:hypothetical protein
MAYEDPTQDEYLDDDTGSAIPLQKKGKRLIRRSDPEDDLLNRLDSFLEAPLPGRVLPDAPAPEQKGNSFLDSMKDVGVSAAAGAGSLVKGIGTIGGLITGDMEGNTVRELGKSAEEYWDNLKSGKLKKLEGDRAAKVAAADGELQKGWTAVKETLTNPALAATFFSSQLPNMIPGAVVGRALVLGTAARLGPEAAAILGEAGGIGAGAAAQGGDVAGQTYDDVRKIPQEVWDANPEYQALLKAPGTTPEQAKIAFALKAGREAGLAGSIISVITNGLLPGGNAIEKFLVGGAKGVGKGGVKGAIKAGAKDALGEGTGEFLEEGGGQMSNNLAKREIDPNQSIMEGTGENAMMGALGGLGTGGAVGMIHGSRAEVSQSTPEPAADIAAQVKSMLDPATTKDAVFVAKGNEDAIPADLPQNVMVAEREEGTLLTTNPTKANTFNRAPSLSDDDMAKMLGYPETKASAAAGPNPAVIQGKDANGNVVSEAVTSDNGKAATQTAIAGQTPAGGAIEQTTPEQAQARRSDQIAQEPVAPGVDDSAQVQQLLADVPTITEEDQAAAVPAADTPAAAIQAPQDAQPLAGYPRSNRINLDSTDQRYEALVQELEDTLNKDAEVPVQIDHQSVGIVDTDGPNADPVYSRLATQLKKALNIDLLVIDAPQGIKDVEGKTVMRWPEGASLSGSRTIVFNKAAQGRSVLNILGHELAHQLKAEYPEVWDKLAKVALDRVNQKKAAMHARELVNAGEKRTGVIDEEIVSEVVGEQMGQPDFWHDVMKDEDESFINSLMKVISDLLDKFTKALTGSGFITATRDVQAIRSAIKQAFKMWEVAVEHTQRLETMAQSTAPTSEVSNAGAADQTQAVSSETQPVSPVSAGNATQVAGAKKVSKGSDAPAADGRANDETGVPKKDATVAPATGKRQAKTEEENKKRVKEVVKKGLAPEQVNNEGRKLDPKNKFVPLYDPKKPFVSDAVDEGKIPLTMDAAAFKEIIDERASLFANPGAKRKDLTAIAKAGPFISQQKADKIVDSWKKAALDQTRQRLPNYEKTILVLFDYTGTMSQPWIDAGYNVHTFDIQDGVDIMDLSPDWFDEQGIDPGDIYGIIAMPPCTDFTNASSRTFVTKDADGRTEASKDLVIRSLDLVEHYRPKFWMVENPVGRIERLTGLPQSNLFFDYSNFGSPEGKREMLWGKFNNDMPTANVERTERKTDKVGGKSLETKNERSETPEGFAYSFFMANNYAAKDEQTRLIEDFPEASGAIMQAIRAKLPMERIREICEDTYNYDDAQETRDELAEAINETLPEKLRGRDSYTLKKGAAETRPNPFGTIVSQLDNGPKLEAKPKRGPKPAEQKVDENDDLAEFDDEVNEEPGLRYARDPRDASRFRDIWSNDENGLEMFYGKDWFLDPVRVYDATHDFTEEDGLDFGHAEHVTEGNRAIAYNIFSDDKKKLGKAVLQLDNAGNIVALHDIVIEARSKGLGTDIVRNIVASNDQPVRIIQMVPTALKFWESVGVYGQDQYDNGFIDWNSFRTSERGRKAALQGASVQGHAGSAIQGSGGSFGASEGQGAEDTGIRFARVATDTPAFRNWFRDSVITEPDGSPAVMFHGTAQDIMQFRAKQAGAIFVTDDPKFADSFADASRDWMVNNLDKVLSPDAKSAAIKAATQRVREKYKGNRRELKEQLEHLATSPIDADFYLEEARNQLPTGPNVLPVFVRAENPFDYSSNDHMDALRDYEEGVRYTDKALHADDLARIKNGSWDIVESERVQRALKTLGFDGFYVTEGGRKNLAVYQPEQLKSAIGNNGKFDPNSPDLRFARVPNRKGNRFTVPKETWMNRLQDLFQNNFNRVRKVQDAVAAQGGKVDETNDAYLAQERMMGATASRIDWFTKQKVKPLLKEIGKSGVDMDDLALYMYALHAQERNAYIRSINPGVVDGSGMSDQDAQSLLTQFRTDPKFTQMHGFAKRLQDITKDTQNVMVAGGLVDPSVVQAWNNEYSNYVPLKGFENIDEQGSKQGLGRGYDVRGPEARRALGRQSRAGQLIENIVRDHERAIARAEKNKVARAFLKFVRENQDDKLWEVNRMVIKPSYQKSTGMVLHRLEKVEDRERTIVAKDHGVEYHIVITDPRLHQQLIGEKGLFNLEGTNGKIFSAWGSVNRTLTKLWTALNPVFTVTNFARDYLTAAISGMTQMGPKFAVKVAGYAFPAMGGIYSGERSDTPAAIGANGPQNWKEWYQRYQEDGGKAGFYQFSEIEDKQRELETLFKQAQDASAGGMRALRSKSMAFIRASEDLIMDANGAIENATRVAAYRAAIEAGKTRAQAASIAKNLTVNFNRRGVLSPSLGSFFLFFNPAVQGTTRIVQAAKDNPVAFGAMTASLVGLGILFGAMNAGDKDDEGIAYWDKESVPDYEKSKNLIIMQGNGARIAIPLAYGYGWFVHLGYALADIGRGRSIAEAGAEVLKSMLQHYSPLNTDSPAQLLTPTAFGPVIQQAMNQRGTGTPLRPNETKMDGTPVPESERYWSATRGSNIQRVTDWLNEATGGDKAVAGKVSISPEVVKNYITGYTGGAGTFISDLINGTMTTTNLDFATALEKGEVPFAKQLYKFGNSRGDQMSFMKNSAKALEAMNESKLYYDTDKPAILERIEKNRGLAELGYSVHAITMAMSALRKQEIAIREQNLPAREEYAALKELDKQKQELWTRWNADFYNLNK